MKMHDDKDDNEVMMTEQQFLAYTSGCIPSGGKYASRSVFLPLSDSCLCTPPGVHPGCTPPGVHSRVLTVRVRLRVYPSGHTPLGVSRLPGNTLSGVYSLNKETDGPQWGSVVSLHQDMGRDA